jgi:hypothetical protein
MLDGALLAFYANVGAHVGQRGIFDYQREGNHVTGFTSWLEYRHASNINVGLFCQQAGMTLDETLAMADRFSSLRSKNHKPDQPFRLDRQTAEFIKKGYEFGESGGFEPPARAFSS